MKKILFLIILTACSLKLPAELPKNFKSPIHMVKNDKELLVYLEQEENGYAIIGIHPLSGREFLVQVRAGKLVREEYGYFYSSKEVREIIEEIIVMQGSSE